jgi:hypothetical protein
MQRISEVCPPGALKWAREAHPALAERIDTEIFRKLNELWGSYSPLQAALDDLLGAHSVIGSLFVQRHS